MIGRYGIDKLWSVLLIFFFVITLLANAFYKVSKITYYAIEIMALVLVVFAIFRVFSKISRLAERKMQSGLSLKTASRAFSNFKTINSSNAKLISSLSARVVKNASPPRHKGKINVTCPHCHTQFVVNTGKKATNNQ